MIKKKKLIFIGGIHVAVFLIGLIISITMLIPKQTNNYTLSKKNDLVKISISGAVNKQKSFYIKKGQCLSDVKNLFGGFKNDADINDEFISTPINENKIIQVKKIKPININNCKEEDLKILFKDEETINKIILYRKNKKFKHKEDLLKNAILSKDIYIKIKDRIYM